MNSGDLDSRLQELDDNEAGARPSGSRLTFGVDEFIDVSGAYPPAPVGEHQHREVSNSSFVQRISIYRGHTPLEAANAYAEDALTMVSAGWRAVAHSMSFNLIQHVGVIFRDGAPQFVGQSAMIVTWERRSA